MKFSLNCIDPGTERIDFKKVSQRDIEEFHSYSLNKQIYEFLEFEPFVNIKESEEYIKKIINRIDSGKGDYRFLRLKNKSEIIGLVGMHSYNHSRNSIEYGFAISPIHQKRVFSRRLLIICWTIYLLKVIYTEFIHTQWKIIFQQ